MKYVLRTLWLIGYVFVFILACTCFLIMFLAYPLVEAFCFIKTGDCENVTFTPADLPIWIDKKYKELIKNL